MRESEREREMDKNKDVKNFIAHTHKHFKIVSIEWMVDYELCNNDGGLLLPFAPVYANGSL